MKKGSLICGNISGQVKIHDKDYPIDGWTVLSSETNWKPMVPGNGVGKWEFFYEDGKITSDYPRRGVKAKFYREQPAPKPVLRPGTKVTIECEVMSGGDYLGMYRLNLPNNGGTWVHEKHFKTVKQPFAIGDEVKSDESYGDILTIKGFDGDKVWCFSNVYFNYYTYSLEGLEHV